MTANAIHYDILFPSTPDTIQLGVAVEQRFIEVCGTHLRIKGVTLVPPAALNKDMMLWRRMRVRHDRGDLRNSIDELNATKTIAQWTVDVNCTLRNQGTKRVAWKE
jgi:hypothetical protein